ncbi:MAG: AAA family ATPase [Candidatus Lutacidiplasmatales archaeon]
MALFIVVRGRVGAGKTSLAKGLVGALGFTRIDYDAAMMQSYVAYEGGSGLEAVRDLSRHDGRTSVGLEAASHISAGRSVVVDADLRDAAELSDIINAAQLGPGGPRLLVIRLEVARKVAQARMMTDAWEEFRTLGASQASRIFSALWSYPLSPVPGERTIPTDARSADEVLDAVCAIIREVGWDRPTTTPGGPLR